MISLQIFSRSELNVTRIRFRAGAQSIQSGAHADNANPGHVALKQRIRSLGRTVGNKSDVLRQNAPALQNLVQNLNDPFRHAILVVVSGRNFHFLNNFIRLIIYNSGIGKSASNIYPYSNLSSLHILLLK
ncbi:hypothetical protein D3C77_350600 [compost metagenome]